MRLTQGEIDTIVRIAREIYGWGVEVFLFGSRTDDSKRGGDIDLLVRSTGEKKRDPGTGANGDQVKTGIGGQEDRCDRGLRG